MVDQATYLGVIFDSKLSWVPHITAKFKKGISSLQACAKAIGKTWGLTPAITRWIYKQVILPSVTYAAFAWYMAVDKRQYLRDLTDRLQRHATLMITRGLKSTPTANLEIMAGLPTINLLFQELAAKTAARLQVQGRWNSNYSINLKGSIDSHAYHTDKLLQQLPITTSRYTDRMICINILDRRFTSQILSRSSIIEFINSLDASIWQIYTDGSKRNNLTGSGFCVQVSNREITAHHYSLGSYPSVFQCELFALHEAADWAIANILTPSTIHFFSDSQAVINTADSTLCNNSMARDTISLLNQLGLLHKVTLFWVPGHTNVVGNDRADELARLGSDTKPIGPEPCLPFSRNHSNTEIREVTLSNHLIQYKKQDISEKGKIPLTDYLKLHRYKSLNFQAIHIKWLTWTFSGHSPLFYFQHKIGKASSPLCDFCQTEEETSIHFLGYCARYATVRLRILGHIIMNWDVLLKCKPAVIIKYIDATDRFNQDRVFKDRT